MSSSNLQMSDWNTLQNIIAVLNATSGTIKLSDSSINAIVTSQPQALNDRAIGNAISQLNTDSITKVLADNNSLSDQTKKDLSKKFDQLNGETPTAGNNVTVTNDLNFGTNTLNGLNSTFTTSGILDLQATILPGSALTAKMDPWEAVDGNSSFKGNLTLPSDGSNGIFTDDKNLNADDTSTVLYNNDGSASKNISQKLTGITLQIPEDQRAAIQATKYKTTITWNVDAKPSATAN